MGIIGGGSPSTFKSETDDLLHLIESVDSDIESVTSNGEIDEEKTEVDWLIRCYGKGFSYYDDRLRGQLFLSEEDLETTLMDEVSLSGINVSRQILRMLRPFLWALGTADGSGGDLAEQLGEEYIVADFLSFPRGGAISAAAGTARKRDQINKLVGIMQEWGNGLDEGDEDDAALKQNVAKLSDTLKGWPGSRISFRSKGFVRP